MKEQYEFLFELEADRCSKTEEQYELHMNRIVNDKGRMMHTTLFVLPDGFAFTDDFVVSDASPSIMDRNMRIIMRELRVTKAVEPGGKAVPQVFYPGYFELRVLSCNAASKELKSKSRKIEAVSSFFSGMKVMEAAPLPQKKKGKQEGAKQVESSDDDASMWMILSPHY